MKNFLILLTLPVLLMACRAHYPVAQQSGKEDMAYLLFVSPKEHSGDNVQVVIDDKTNFTAKVVKARKANRRGTQYGISTGRHKITVSHKGQILYQKEIFVSSQEVKQINLP